MHPADYLSLFRNSLPLLTKGLTMTIEIFITSACLSFILGITLGFLCCSRLRIAFISPSIEVLTFILRGVPFFVQLLIVYFVLPDLLFFNLEPFAASFIALGLCSSGYVAQMVRAGIHSIPESQWEAAFSLGYSTYQTIRYIILPQLLRNILPLLNNELDALLKSTAIASSIGVLELTRVGMNIVSSEMQPVPIYLTIACFYVCLSALLNIFTRTLERRVAYVND